MNKIACVIGNGGLGDMIVCIGIVNYLATKYDKVIVSCMNNTYEQAKYFYNKKNIILYPINKYDNTTMYQYDIMMRNVNIYDVYAYGHYGAREIDYGKYYKKMANGDIKPIIHDYPISYYEDINFPIEYMTKYFSVEYPQYILDSYVELKKYGNYAVIHQSSSNMEFDILKHNNLDINSMLIIDVNKNLYNKNHKYYDIANKFVNLRSVIYYTKLIENASSLYLMDSCMHAIALIVNIDNVYPKICYQRESRIKYGFNKFEYFLMVNGKPIKTQLPLLKSINTKK